MNRKQFFRQDSHQQIQLLLPWYVNRSLSPHEMAEVESHVRLCLVCRRELIALDKLSKAVTDASALDIAAENSFANLSAKIKLSPTAAKTPNVSLSEKSSRRGKSRYFVAFAGRYALAASVLLGVLMLFMQSMQHWQKEDFYTLSSGAASLKQEGDLRVVFAKSVSKADVTNILSKLHGQQIGEANSMGALTIRLQSDASEPEVQQAVNLLRSRQDVLLAEPVIRP